MRPAPIIRHTIQNIRPLIRSSRGQSSENEACEQKKSEEHLHPINLKAGVLSNSESGRFDLDCRACGLESRLQAGQGDFLAKSLEN